MQLESLTALHKLQIREILDENGLSEDGIFNSNVALFGFFKEGVLLAMGGLEYYGKIAMIRSVCTKESYKAKGIGSLLMNRLISKARKEDLQQLYLLTEEASGFFKKLKFANISFLDLPHEIQKSSLVKNVCSDSAACMKMDFV